LNTAREGAATASLGNLLTYFRKEASPPLLKLAMFSCVMADRIELILAVLSLYVLAL